MAHTNPIQLNAKELETVADIAMHDTDSIPTVEDVLQQILSEVKDFRKEVSERIIRDEGAGFVGPRAPAVQIGSGNFQANPNHPLPLISPQMPGQYPDNAFMSPAEFSKPANTLESKPVQVGSEGHPELPQHLSDVEKAKLQSLHEAERKKFIDEIGANKQLWEDAREKNIELSKQLAEQNTKLIKLQKMMVRAGRNDSPSIDGDINAQFVLLKSDILQLVKGHLAHPDKQVRSPGESPDLLELYVRMIVASALHEGFFSRRAMPFGYGDYLLENNPLRHFEEALINRHCDESAIKEWRVATVKACNLLDLDLAGYAMTMCHQIWQKNLNRYCIHKTPSKRDACYKELGNLCKSAAKLAILFRGSTIEYKWEQDISGLDSLEVIPKDHEIIGTKGPSPEEKNYEISFIVFGGVVRGDKSTGLLENGRMRLSRTQIVIGDRKP